MERKLFLNRVSIDEALAALSEICGKSEQMPVEHIQLDEAVGRVAAETCYAKISAPSFNAAAMDGIAVISRTTFGAREATPLALRIGQDAFWVNTGNPIPDGFDAVIMVEHVNMLDENTAEIIEPAPPYQHVRPAGEDFVKSELLVPENQTIREEDICALLAGGYETVPVRKRPVVAVIATGDELTRRVEDLRPGMVMEHNSSLVASLVRKWGGSPVVYPIIKDDMDLIEQAVSRAVASSDAVIVNAGSSAGSKDFTYPVLSKLGEVKVHGVKIKPGKPVMLAQIDNKPVIGLPGYPLACYINSTVFVKAMMENLLGATIAENSKIPVRIGRKIISQLGEQEFIFVKIGFVDGKAFANPLSRGSGVTSNLAKADGYVVLSPESQGIDENALCDAHLLRPLEDIMKTVVIVGSHDLSIDLLGTEIKKIDHRFSVSSAHVGSMGGFMAIANGQAHAAGVHSLDDKTGVYNVRFAEQFLGEDYCLVNVAMREQGMIVKKGNPLGLDSIRSIVEKKARFINRQRGAGTRQLFDYMLAQDELAPQDVVNYTREAITHLAVASEVLNDTADVGLGIKAAADALDLDFIMLANEEYDILFKSSLYDADLIQMLLTALKSEHFKQELYKLGGYDMSMTGKVMAMKGR